jgi:hypothetical protein
MNPPADIDVTMLNKAVLWQICQIQWLNEFGHADLRRTGAVPGSPPQ